MPGSTIQSNPWQRYILYGASVLLTLISLYIRFKLFPVVSIDYTVSLSHWMDALHGAPGLGAFKYPFSDYAPLYLYFLKILTLLPFSYLYSIKGLTLLFDVGTAVMAALIVKMRRPAFSLPTLILVGAIVFTVPTVILNGAAWAQVDAAYTFCILISLYYILKDKPLAATIAFAFAFSFKLQSIFFLPILIGYIISRMNKIWYLVLIPVVYAITVVPAWLAGGSLWNWLTIYFHQSQESPILSRSAPSLFAFIDPNHATAFDYPTAPKIGLALAFVAALLIIATTAWFADSRYQRKKSLIALSLISAIAIPFFLPYMHDRYFYLADVLSIIFVWYEYYLVFIPVAVILASFYSYLPFLSATVPQVGPYITHEGYLGALMLFALTIMTGWFSYRWYMHNKQQIM